MLELIAILVLLASCLVGFLAIFFAAGGTLIIFFGALVYALLTNFATFNVYWLVLIFVLYVIGEILEFFMTAWGAKQFGASNWAVAGAMIGGIAGVIWGAALAGIGAFFGVFIGIFTGAFLAEWLVKGDVRQSIKAGTGGVFGRVGAIAVKTVIALIIIAMLAVKIIAAAPQGLPKP